MLKKKAIVGLGLVIIIVISIWMGITSGPISGIAVFFILTLLLWAIARVRHWI